MSNSETKKFWCLPLAATLRGRGYSVRRAAERLGVSRGHLHRVVTGERESASLVRRIELLPQAEVPMRFPALAEARNWAPDSVLYLAAAAGWDGALSAAKAHLKTSPAEGLESLHTWRAENSHEKNAEI